jgi:hypothetical protein
MSDTMVGKWPHHVGCQPAPYGDEASYCAGAEWLKGLSRVDDRGCGLAWFERVMWKVDPACYVANLDGSGGPGSNRQIVDLAQYVSPLSGVPGIFMRHVLEHNHEWKAVLECACKSFTKRMFLVLFTPLCPECDPGPHDLYAAKFNPAHCPTCPPDHPGSRYVAWSFRESDITNILKSHDLKWTRETILSPKVEFNLEHLFRIER